MEKFRGRFLDKEAIKEKRESDKSVLRKSVLKKWTVLLSLLGLGGVTSLGIYSGLESDERNEESAHSLELSNEDLPEQVDKLQEVDDALRVLVKEIEKKQDKKIVRKVISRKEDKKLFRQRVGSDNYVGEEQNEELSEEERIDAVLNLIKRDFKGVRHHFSDDLEQKVVYLFPEVYSDVRQKREFFSDFAITIKFDSDGTYSVYMSGKGNHYFDDPIKAIDLDEVKEEIEYLLMACQYIADNNDISENEVKKGLEDLLESLQ